jgi:hypothetical protein
MKQCKSDEILNPKTGRCVKKSGKIGKEIMKSQIPDDTIDAFARMNIASTSISRPKTPSPRTSIVKVERSGNRKREFDSMKYMSIDQRTQYILDRFLKRIPTENGVTLNSAMKRRQQHYIEVGAIADSQDDEDLKEAVQRGWISKFDVVKYYTLRNGREPKPLLPGAEQIVYSNEEVKPKVTYTSTSKTQTQEVNRGIKDEKSLAEFFDKLEKDEKKSKTASNILEQGFVDLSLSGASRNKIFSSIRSGMKRERERIMKDSGISARDKRK